MDKPEFNPNQPYEPVKADSGSKPAFDPNQAYEPVPNSSTDKAISDLVDDFHMSGYNKLTPEQKDKFYDAFKEHNANVIAGVARGVQKGAGLPFELASLVSNKLSPAALSSSFEKNVVAPIGDALTGNDTSELYNNKPDEAMQGEYNQQIQQAQQKAPGPFIAGNMAGSLPTYALAGGAAGAGAKGLGAALGTGAELTGEAANAVTGGQKLAQAGLNIPAQTTANAAVASGQGYNADPFASEAQKEASAKRGALIGGGLGALGTAAGEAPGLISSAGKNASNKLLSNASLGAEGVNTATQAGKEAITTKGEQLASEIGQGVTNLNNTLGKQAAGDIQHAFGQTAKDAQTSVEDIVNKVAGNLDTIGKTDGQAAVDTINNSFAEALKQTGESLDLTGSKLTEFIKTGLNKYGPVIKQELANAAEQGKTISVDENFLKTFLAIKNAKVSLSEANNVQEKLWKNWADTLYDVSENTIKQKAGTIPGGTMSEVSVQGKGVLPSQLPNPQTQPEFVQGAQGNPESPAIQPSTSQPAAPNAQGQPGVNTPLSVTTNKNAQATSGQFMGQPYSNQAGTQVNQTFTPKTEIPVTEAKQFSKALGNAAGNPNLEEIQPLAANLAQQLRKSITSTLGPDYASASSKYSSLKSALEEMGTPRIEAEKITGDNITPEGIMGFVQKAAKMSDQGDTASLERVYGHLNEVDPTFAANFKNEVDAVSRQSSAIRKAQNASPMDKATLLQEQGKSTPEVSQAQQTLQDLGTVQKQVGTSAPKIRQFVQNLNPSDIGSQNDLNQLLSTLDRIDPESAALLRSKTAQSAVAKNTALEAAANKTPQEQAATLQNVSDVGPLKTTQAAQNLDKLTSVNKNVGATTELGTPSDTTRSFVKDFGKTAETPDAAARASDINATVDKLSELDPTLAARIKTNTPEVARQLRAIDYSQSGSPFGSVANKALGGVSAVAYKGANVLGQGARQLGKLSGATNTANSVVNTAINSKVSNSLNTISGVIRQSPQSLGKYAAPLKEALDRGPEALAASIFAMSQRDPEFKKAYDAILNDQGK